LALWLAGVACGDLTMEDQVAVRPLREADCSKAAEIWVSGLQQTVEASSVLMRPLCRYAFRRLADKATAPDGDMGPNGSNLVSHWSGSDRYMMVAELAGEIVGVCGVKRGTEEDKEALPDCKDFSIWRLSVAADARRAGVGIKLMTSAQDWAREAGGHRMLLITGNPIARRFYCERMGYCPLGWREAVAPWFAKSLTTE